MRLVDSPPVEKQGGGRLIWAGGAHLSEAHAVGLLADLGQPQALLHLTVPAASLRPH